MKLKVPRLTPKKVIDTAKDPRTYWKIFNQLFPLGQGGLRTGYEPPQSDFLGDISVPYDYSSTPSEDLDLGGGRQERTAPRSGQESKEPEKHGNLPKTDPRAWPYPWRDPNRHPTVPWIPGGYPIDVPIPNIGIPNIWPTGVPGGWPEIPVPPDQPEEYEDPEFKTDVYQCDPELNAFLGLPPCTKEHAPFSIQTSTFLRKKGQNGKTNSESRHGNRSRKKSLSSKRYYTRRYRNGF